MITKIVYIFFSLLFTLEHNYDNNTLKNVLQLRKIVPKAKKKTLIFKSK